MEPWCRFTWLILRESNSILSGVRSHQKTTHYWTWAGESLNWGNDIQNIRTLWKENQSDFHIDRRYRGGKKKEGLKFSSVAKSYFFLHSISEISCLLSTHVAITLIESLIAFTWIIIHVANWSFLAQVSYSNVLSTQWPK